MKSTISLALAAALALGCKQPPAPAVEDPATSVETPATTEVVQAETPKPDSREVNPKDVARRHGDAVAQLTVGDQAAARRAKAELEKLAASDPKNPFVFYNLGVAHDQLGETAQAERALRQAIANDPTMGRAHLGLGLLLEREGRVDDALAEYRKGIQADQEDMEIRSALIGALRRKGQLDQAIEEARSALAYNSKSIPVYNDLGLVYIDKGDLSMARFVFLKAIGQVDGAKNSAPIRCNFGWALYLQGEAIQARRQLEEAHALDPKYLPALVYLAHLYLDDRNFTDAAPLLEEAVRQEPDNYGAHVNLGIAYRGLGRLDQAKATYQKAASLKPGSPDPYLNMGVLEGDYYKNYDAAIQSFRTYLDKGGDQRALVEEYIDDVEKERGRAEKKAQAAEERKKREAERLERERLLKEAEARQGADKPAPAPEQPDQGGDAPWGPQ